MYVLHPEIILRALINANFLPLVIKKQKYTWYTRVVHSVRIGITRLLAVHGWGFRSLLLLRAHSDNVTSPTCPIDQLSKINLDQHAYTKRFSSHGTV